ncbi:MAG: hypothetical protein ACE5JH_10940 [Acidobacteriota bacterium]
MVAEFSLEAINRKGSVFDERKLEWLNGLYINDTPAAALIASIRPRLESEGLWEAALGEGGSRHAWFQDVVGVLKPRSRLLTDLVRDARPFLTEEFEYQPEAVAKHLTGTARDGGAAAIAARMRALRRRLADVAPFTEEKAEEALRGLAASRGEPAALFIHPLRVALVGRAVSPGVFTILALAGRERALARLDRLVSFLSARAS